MDPNIKENSPAPLFDLPADSGSRVDLASLRGRKVVLYFYPKDDTSGCTREAIDFTELADKFEEIGATVVGISPDSPSAHDKFKKKHGLDISLASDETKSALNAYGVWKEKSMYGRKFMGVERSTFLIDETGIVRRVWRKVKVPGHAAQVLDAASSLERT